MICSPHRVHNSIHLFILQRGPLSTCMGRSSNLGSSVFCGKLTWYPVLAYFPPSKIPSTEPYDGLSVSYINSSQIRNPQAQSLSCHNLGVDVLECDNQQSAIRQSWSWHIYSTCTITITITITITSVLQAAGAHPQAASASQEPRGGRGKDWVA